MRHPDVTQNSYYPISTRPSFRYVSYIFMKTKRWRNLSLLSPLPLWRFIDELFYKNRQKKKNLWGSSSLKKFFMNLLCLKKKKNNSHTVRGLGETGTISVSRGTVFSVVPENTIHIFWEYNFFFFKDQKKITR